MGVALHCGGDRGQDIAVGCGFLCAAARSFVVVLVATRRRRSVVVRGTRAGCGARAPWWVRMLLVTKGVMGVHPRHRAVRSVLLPLACWRIGSYGVCVRASDIGCPRSEAQGDGCIRAPDSTVPGRIFPKRRSAVRMRCAMKYRRTYHENEKPIDLDLAGRTAWTRLGWS